VANATGLHTNSDLSRARLRDLALHNLEFAPGSGNLNGFHFGHSASPFKYFLTFDYGRFHRSLHRGARHAHMRINRPVQDYCRPLRHQWDGFLNGREGTLHVDVCLLIGDINSPVIVIQAAMVKR
jgi:hypothetical protein